MTQQVLVAGGGPVGLALALLLARAGVPVTVVEQVRDRASEGRAAQLSGAMGMRALNVPSGRLLGELGLIEAIRERALWWLDPAAMQQMMTTRPEPGATRPPVFIGHFGGIGLKADNLDPAALAASDPGFGAGAVSLADIVAVLEKAAQAAGVTIRMGEAVHGLTHSEESVSVETEAGVLAADWLVGCDGGRSVVRKAAGIGFPGTDAEYVGRVATVRFTGAETPPVGDWVLGPHGAYIHAPEGRLHIVEYGAAIADRDAPVTDAELAATFLRVSGTPLAPAEVLIGTRYTDAARQAERYRAGRVLLAGDAAHIHSPAGGQGLNQGLADAACLAPLLAAVARGEAAPQSLDAYEAERRPIGAAILDWTRAQTAAGRPDPASRALRAVLVDLLDSAPSTAYVLRRLSGEPGGQ